LRGGNGKCQHRQECIQRFHIHFQVMVGGLVVLPEPVV
jgi:hypothetical protein